MRALRDHGHEVVPDGEVVLVAGGDGTVTREASRLVEKRVPLLVLPMGTANNVARSLGYRGAEVPVEYALEALDHHDERDFDVGLSRTRFGKSFFYEGAGVGLFADALDGALTSEDKEPARAARKLAEHLAQYEPHEVEVTLDGKDCSGEYVMVDVLNVARFGPNLHLAPGANPFDGELDVVLVKQDEVAALTHYLEGLGRREDPPAPPVEVRRAKKIGLRLHGRKLRLDGRLHPRRDVSGQHRIELAIMPGALRVWLPRSRAPEQEVVG